MPTEIHPERIHPQELELFDGSGLTRAIMTKNPLKDLVSCGPGKHCAHHGAFFCCKCGAEFQGVELTSAQRKLLELAQSGAIHIRGSQVRTARTLVALGIGALTDDGAFGPNHSSNIDGQRWTFELTSTNS
jgi:hypothetical protein